MQTKRNIIHATINAIDGLKVLILEKAARRELLLIIFSVSLFCYRSNIYTALISVLSLVLFSIEALNTAIEKICNLITMEKHPEVKKIKDLGAASVLIILFLIGIIFICFLIDDF